MMIKIDCDNREMLISINSIVCVIPSNRDEKEYLIEFKETSSFLISQKEFNQLNVKIQQICENYVWWFPWFEVTILSEYNSLKRKT